MSNQLFIHRSEWFSENLAFHRVALRDDGEVETRDNSEVGTFGSEPASGYTVSLGFKSILLHPASWC